MQLDVDAFKMFYESRLSDVGANKHQVNRKLVQPWGRGGEIFEVEVRFQQEQPSKAKMQQDLSALNMFYESKLSDVGAKQHLLNTQLFEKQGFVMSAIMHLGSFVYYAINSHICTILYLFSSMDIQLKSVQK